MPIFIAAYNNPEGDNDIARLVLKPKESLTWKYDLVLPQDANPNSTDDMGPINSLFGQGVVYLYKVGGTQSLAFITTEEKWGSHTVVDLNLPNHGM